MGEHRNAGFWWRNLKERLREYDNIKMQLKETGWEDINWTHLAQDRDMVRNPGIT
jgi:hypothetical protein